MEIERLGTTMAREQFATQVESELLQEMRDLAQEDDRRLEALVNDALAEYIERRHRERTRPHVMAAYESSHDRYASVYKKLAR
jgi:hypothetical protein